MAANRSVAELEELRSTRSRSPSRSRGMSSTTSHTEKFNVVARLLSGREAVVSLTSGDSVGLARQRIACALGEEPARLNLAIDGRVLLDDAAMAAEEGFAEGALLMVVWRPLKKVLTASSDGTARVFEIQNGTCEHVLVGHRKQVNTTSFSPDGRKILTASWDGTARLYDLYTGDCEHIFEGHCDGIYSAAFSPDGDWVLTASWDRTSRLFNTDSGQCECVIDLEGPNASMGQLALRQGKQSAVTIEPSQKFQLVGNCLVHVATGACKLRFPGHRSTSAESASREVVSPDGLWILSTTWKTGAGAVRILCASTRQVEMTLEGHRGPVCWAAFTPDSQKILTASYDHTARLFDIDSGDCELVLKGHTGPVCCAAFL